MPKKPALSKRRKSTPRSRRCQNFRKNLDKMLGDPLMLKDFHDQVTERQWTIINQFLDINPSMLTIYREMERLLWKQLTMHLNQISDSVEHTPMQIWREVIQYFWINGIYLGKKLNITNFRINDTLANTPTESETVNIKHGNSLEATKNCQSIENIIESSESSLILAKSFLYQTTSEDQWNIMIDFMAQNPILLDENLSGISERQTVNILWAQLTKKLNESNSGGTKPIFLWRQCFNIYKGCLTRRKNHSNDNDRDRRLYYLMGNHQVFLKSSPYIYLNVPLKSVSCSPCKPISSAIPDVLQKILKESNYQERPPATPILKQQPTIPDMVESPVIIKTEIDIEESNIDTSPAHDLPPSFSMQAEDYQLIEKSEVSPNSDACAKRRRSSSSERERTRRKFCSGAPLEAKSTVHTNKKLNALLTALKRQNKLIEANTVAILTNSTTINALVENKSIHLNTQAIEAYTVALAELSKNIKLMIESNAQVIKMHTDKNEGC